MFEVDVGFPPWLGDVTKLQLRKPHFWYGESGEVGFYRFKNKQKKRKGKYWIVL